MPNLNPNGRLVVSYVGGDQGTGRPLPQGTAVWASPNIRLATEGEKDALLDPAYWDRPEAAWDGRVFVDTKYYLLVRVLNRGDFATEPHDVPMPLHGISMEGWVSDFTAGYIGPASQIDPPPNPDINGDTAFSGIRNVVLEPNAQTVVASDGFWRPQAGDINHYNGGHVCVGVNVFSAGGDVIGGGGGVIHVAQADATYPADGKKMRARPITTQLNVVGDTHHGQRNIMITPKPVNATLVRQVLVEVPADDRCPLEAEVALRPVALQTDGGDAQRVAAAVGLERYHCPTDPLDNVGIDDDGDPSHEVGIFLKPGERRWLTITVAPAENERPGDIYAFDIVTTEEGTERLYGAARMYVAVVAEG
ncbi:hypothetical protein ACWDSJ_09595 [Nocardia sp. NPDC003482]